MILSCVLTKFCCFSCWVLMGSLIYLLCLHQPTGTSTLDVPNSHAIYKSRAAQVCKQHKSAPAVWQEHCDVQQLFQALLVLQAMTVFCMAVFETYMTY